ncbi:MAG: DnaJ domain-containing protein [Saprospiraceae bacterium]
MKNYYKILNVESNSDIIVIKKSFRNLSNKYHPDKNRGNNYFDNYYKDIVEAYGVLSDKEARQKYDKIFNDDKSDFENFDLVTLSKLKEEQIYTNPLKSKISISFASAFIGGLILIIISFCIFYFISSGVSEPDSRLNIVQDLEPNVNGQSLLNDKVYFKEDYRYLYKTYTELDDIHTIENLGKIVAEQHMKDLPQEIGSFERYETLFSGVDRSNLFGVIYAANYIKKNISIESNFGNEIFISYFQLYKHLIDYYVDNFHPRYKSTISLNNNMKLVNPEKFKVFEENLKAFGIMIDFGDFSHYLNYDYEYLSRLFKGRVSEDIMEYLEFNAIELREDYEDDGGLKISQQQLFQRILKWEMYLEKYPNSYFRNYAQAIYKNYVNVLLFGLDNSPVFNDDGKLNDKHKLFLEYISQRYHYTKTVEFIKSYFLQLEQNDYHSSYGMSMELRNEIDSSFQIINY